MQDVFGFVKRNLSEAKRRMDAASEERGAGKGAAALVPASAHRRPEREQRSGTKMNFRIVDHADEGSRGHRYCRGGVIGPLSRFKLGSRFVVRVGRR